MSWSSTDAVSVCLILFALTETINIIYKKEDSGLLRTLALGILFCLPFFFRYMYLPIAVLLPAVILLFGILARDKNSKKNGVRTLTVSVSFLVLYFLVSLFSVGNALHVTDVGRGFFINQFVECYPFLPASFINVDFGAQLIQTVFGIDYSVVIVYLKIINCLILVLLLFLLGRYIKTHKRASQFSNHFLFIIIGAFVSIAIILLLAWLTLTYKELSWGFYKWTHVQDPRYFAFIYVFIPLLFFICLQYYSSSFKKPILRFFIFIGLCCFAIEVIHGVYYNIKILSKHKDLAYIRAADQGFKSFPAIITKIKEQNPDKELLVCSPDQFYLHTASQMGYKAIFDYTNFLQTDLKVSSKSLLIMPIQSQDVVIIKDYIERKKPRLLYTVGSISFYIQEIDP